MLLTASIEAYLLSGFLRPRLVLLDTTIEAELNRGFLISKLVLLTASLDLPVWGPP